MAQSSHTFDPGQEQIGTVYAKALVAAAEKAGQSDQVVEELEEIVTEVFDKLPQVSAAFMSPRLAHEEKLLMLDKAFGGKVSTTTLNFLKVLSRHGRMGSVRATARSARKLLNESRNRVEVEVRTAAPLSNPLREAISKKLAAMLEREDVAFDIGGYRSAPPGLRIWCGATIDKEDVEALTHWLDWAWSQVKAS